MGAHGIGPSKLRLWLCIFCIIVFSYLRTAELCAWNRSFEIEIVALHLLHHCIFVSYVAPQNCARGIGPSKLRLWLCIFRIIVFAHWEKGKRRKWNKGKREN